MAHARAEGDGSGIPRRTGRVRWWRGPLRARWARWWLVCVVLAFGLEATLEFTSNVVLLPAVLLCAAVSGPAAFWAYASDQDGMRQAVRADTVLGVMIVGGAIGLAAAAIVGYQRAVDLPVAQLLLVGVIEEPAKLIVPVLLFFVGYRSPRAGIVLGLASAAGFAVMETMGYGFASAVATRDATTPALLTVVRGTTAPFGHMAWTGFVCAVWWSEWHDRGRFAVTWQVVGALLLAIVLHGLYDVFAFALRGGNVVAVVFFALVAVVSLGLFLRVARRVEPVG